MVETFIMSIPKPTFCSKCDTELTKYDTSVLTTLYETRCDGCVIEDNLEERENYIKQVVCIFPNVVNTGLAAVIGLLLPFTIAFILSMITNCSFFVDFMLALDYSMYCFIFLLAYVCDGLLCRYIVLPAYNSDRKCK